MKLQSKPGKWPEIRPVGSYFLGLIENPDWVMRRVETVKILEHSRIERSVSIDIDTAELSKRIEEAGLPSNLHTVYVPMAVMGKTLILDSDVRVDGGDTASIATSAMDSYVAAAVMLSALERDGFDPATLPETLVDAIYMIAREMSYPDTRSRMGGTGDVASTNSYWIAQGPTLFRTNAERDLWTNLFSHGQFSRLANSFTFQSIVITSLVLDGSRRSHIVKWRYVETDLPASDPFATEEWGLKPFVYMVSAPAIGNAQREHVRILAPQGTSVGLAALWELSSDTLNHSDVAVKSPHTYDARVTAERGIIYTRRLPPSEYLIAVTLHPRLGTFYVPALFSVGLALILLAWAAYFQIFGDFRFDARGPDAVTKDAAVTTLLLIPTLISVFVARNSEHALVARLLRRPRIAVLSTAFFTIISGGAIAMGVGGLSLAILLSVSALVCLSVFALLLTSFLRIRKATSKVRFTSNDVRKFNILIPPGTH